jgi:hypothetical protein
MPSSDLPIARPAKIVAGPKSAKLSQKYDKAKA